MAKFDEYIVCRQIARYLQFQYPKVLYHFDQAGANLSKAQGRMFAAIQHGRGWPDLFVAPGLFLEIKRPGVRILKRNGEFATEHIAEQAAVLEQLNVLGFRARFAVGFDAAKSEIDDYLSGVNKRK